MAKKSSRPKLRPEDHFLKVNKFFIQRPCRAWKALPYGARCLYFLLKSYYNGSNNGAVFLSVRTAADQLGCTPGSAWTWFQELQEKGFIKPAVPGHLGVAGLGVATSWIITELGYRSVRPTKDFERWLPDEKTESLIVK